MALVLKDRVKETTTTTGTGTITLAGAVTGFDSFSVIGDTNTTYYAIVAQTPGEWEVGVGTYTSAGTTLARTTVLANSAGTQPSALSFSAGTKDVFVTYPAGAAIVASDNPGTSGQVLTSNGAGVAPTWEDAGGGGGALTISNKTAAYTVVAGDLGTIINCTSGTFTVSLTAAATLGAGFNCWVWNTSSTSTDVVTIDPSGTETIDLKTTMVLYPGEATQLVCNGTNWNTNRTKLRLYADNSGPNGVRPIATGDRAVAIGSNSTASGTFGFASGYLNSASNTGATALGYFSTASATYSLAINGDAGSSYATAIGHNSGGNRAQAVTGSGAMALGGSYASGTDSFAAAVANNTSSYGATGANSVAVGLLSRASANQSFSFGSGCNANIAFAFALGFNAYANNNYAFAIGDSVTASGSMSVCIGRGSVASASYSNAWGYYASSAIWGKFSYACGRFSATGDAQDAKCVLRRETTNNTASTLGTDGGAATATNQVILPNNSAYAFTGTVIAKQSGSTNAAAWKVEGMIVRGANAASTTLVASTVTAISNTPGWTLALSADTTNGGLAVTATGAAATNIRWVATIQTSEVTYA